MVKLLKGIFGILLVLLGAVWSLQGLNVLPGSVMSGQTMWLVIGIVLILLGGWLLWSLRAARGKIGMG